MSRENETTLHSGRKSQGENDARTAASPRRFPFFFFLFDASHFLWRIPFFQPSLLCVIDYLSRRPVSSKPRWDVPSANWILDCFAIQQAVGRLKKRTQFTIELLYKPQASFGSWKVTQTGTVDDAHPRYMIILLHYNLLSTRLSFEFFLLLIISAEWNPNRLTIIDWEWKKKEKNYSSCYI